MSKDSGDNRKGRGARNGPPRPRSGDSAQRTSPPPAYGISPADASTRIGDLGKGETRTLTGPHSHPLDSNPELPTVIGKRPPEADEWDPRPSDHTKPLPSVWRHEGGGDPVVFDPEPRTDPQAKAQAQAPKKKKQSVPPPPKKRNPSAELEPKETVLDEQYTIEALIGQGVESRVYRAIDRSGTAVAIKEFIGESKRQMDRLLASFESTGYEGQVPGSVVHENVVRILDFARDIERGPLLIMELVNGSSLEATVAKKRRLSALEAARVYVFVAQALEAAHKQGAIVADVHPRQLLFPKGSLTPKLDATTALFAYSTEELLSWLERREAEDIPPELTSERGPEIGLETDVYAFGTGFARAMTGAGPKEALAAPRALKEARKLLTTCLAQDPAARYGSMEEVSRALERIALPQPPYQWLTEIKPGWIAAFGGAVAAVLAVLIVLWIPSPKEQTPHCLSREALRSSIEGVAPLDSLVTLRGAYEQFPACSEVGALILEIQEQPEVKVLRKTHRRKLTKMPAEPSEDQLKEVAESVKQLEKIGLDQEMVDYWKKKLGQ